MPKFEGRGWYDHLGNVVVKMPDNQHMDDYHYRLHDLLHHLTNLTWHEEEADWAFSHNNGELED